MSIRLRGEMPGDEEAIDMVNCQAFEEMDEANLVRLLRRYYPAFDRKYSITAWDEDQMVGHTLYTPARIRLAGQTVTALAVGPVAVVPEQQGNGVGGEMLRYGHEIGRRDGFALAFLCGHPSYYPRHGYKACFGFGKVSIDLDKLPPAAVEFRGLPVCPADIPWLVERHQAEWADVDFAWLWGTSLSEWTIPFVNAVMWWTKDGRRAAYTVGLPGPARCGMLLADDPVLAREVIAKIRPATLEHHPSGWLARNALDAEWSGCEAEFCDAAMACDLQEGVLEAYRQTVQTHDRPTGCTRYPLPFMIC